MVRQVAIASPALAGAASRDAHQLKRVLCARQRLDWTSRCSPKMSREPSRGLSVWRVSVDRRCLFERGFIMSGRADNLRREAARQDG